jgi:hypothetical protein
VGGVAQAAELARRLVTLDGKRLGLLSTGKLNCDALLAELGRLIGQRYRLARVNTWRKPSVYKMSPQKRLDEIAGSCDAVVAGLGDCGHGSSCTFHDVFWLEEREIPVAYVDTPGRLHKVTRDGDVFVMEYFTLKYVVADLMKASPEKAAALRRKLFERQGIYRALRMAGCTVGDRVRLLDWEFALEELPDAEPQWLVGSDGIAGYPYIVTPAIGRLTEDGVRQRATELLPHVLERLVE